MRFGFGGPIMRHTPLKSGGTQKTVQTNYPCDGRNIKLPRTVGLAKKMAIISPLTPLFLLFFLLLLLTFTFFFTPSLLQPCGACKSGLAIEKLLVSYSLVEAVSIFCWGICCFIRPGKFSNICLH